MPTIGEIKKTCKEVKGKCDNCPYFIPEWEKYNLNSWCKGDYLKSKMMERIENDHSKN